MFSRAFCFYDNIGGNEAIVVLVVRMEQDAALQASMATLARTPTFGLLSCGTGIIKMLAALFGGGGGGPVVLLMLAFICHRVFNAISAINRPSPKRSNCRFLFCWRKLPWRANGRSGSAHRLPLPINNPSRDVERNAAGSVETKYNQLDLKVRVAPGQLKLNRFESVRGCKQTNR